MAGVKGRSGRRMKYFEGLQMDLRMKAQVMVHRYLTRVCKLSDDELMNMPRAVEHAMAIEMKYQDIDAKKQIAHTTAAPLLELLRRAEEKCIEIKGTSMEDIEAAIVDDASNNGKEVIKSVVNGEI